MGIKVLSLFDGISCGMVALERAGIKVDRYYASEIDKNAIKISEKNYLTYRDWETDRKSTRLNSSHSGESRMPSAA